MKNFKFVWPFFLLVLLSYEVTDFYRSLPSLSVLSIQLFRTRVRDRHRTVPQFYKRPLFRRSTWSPGRRCKSWCWILRVTGSLFLLSNTSGPVSVRYLSVCNGHSSPRRDFETTSEAFVFSYWLVILT